MSSPRQSRFARLACAVLVACAAPGARAETPAESPAPRVLRIPATLASWVARDTAWRDHRDQKRMIVGFNPAQGLGVARGYVQFDLRALASEDVVTAAMLAVVRDGAERHVNPVELVAFAHTTPRLPAKVAWDQLGLEALDRARVVAVMTTSRARGLESHAGFETQPALAAAIAAARSAPHGQLQLVLASPAAEEAGKASYWKLGGEEDGERPILLLQLAPRPSRP